MVSIALRNLSLNSLICKSHVSVSPSLHNFSSVLCKSFASLSTSSECHVVADPAVYDVLVNKHEFSPQVASFVASDLARSRSQEKSDSILTFLEESGFSSTQLEKIVKCRPRLLTASLEDEIRLKIKTFQEWGFSPDDIAQITSRNQAILHVTTRNRIVPSLTVLKELLGSDHESIIKLLRICPRLVTADMAKTLTPNVELLKSHGIAMAHIHKILFSWPRCLLVKPDFLKRAVEKAKEMGASESSRMFVYGVRVFASMSEKAWEKKLRDFRGMGFSDRDLLVMFGKAPNAVMVSKRKIKKMKELLVSTGKFGVSSIVDHPCMLGCSVEKRMKPRLRILGILESKNLIKKWPSLGTIYTLSDDKFLDRFVWRYSEKVGKAFNNISYLNGREKEI